ncbi:VWA domain-containing protein [Thermodesulfobacteriota bacterium]
MKPKFGGSRTLFLTVIIITAFLTGGCGVSGGGGSGSGGGSAGSGTPTGTPPDIDVSANQLLFGGIVFNTGIDLKNFADRTLTIQNKGTLDLNIGQIALNDPLDPPFRIVTDDCSVQTLASLRTCTLVVRFAPTDQGDDFNDTFDIPSNDPDEDPVTVTVSGDGKGLNVSINQVSRNCPLPKVTLYITVSDEDGDPLAPLLTKTNFSLFENGVPIDPGDISFDDAPPSPQSIALVLDISVSMEGAIDEMQAAAENFIIKLFASPDPNEAEIIRFAKSIEAGTSTGFTTDEDALKDAIRAPIPNDFDFRDGTAMYDAVEQAVADTALLDPSRRRAVVVIADGRDNSSDTDLNGLIDQALESGVPVFTIGLGDVNAENMQQLADETGGQYYYAPTESELGMIYDQISEIISSQYKLDYDSLSPCGNIISLDVVVDDGSVLHLKGEDSRDIIFN